jgi:threonylcarbamoyladenosine tRNA methylthiotransferase MtaB
MNRHYDTEFFADLVARIRSMFPDAAITTDIMVGFAGETEQEFCESVEFLKKIGFAKAHVFAYSRRKGTVAYGLPDQITRAEKSRRSRIMLAAAAECEQEFVKQQIGKQTEVLFETCENGIAEGYTSNYLRVCTESDEILEGQIKKIKLTASKGDSAFGEIVE